MPTPDLKDDLLRGVKAIAEYRGESARRVLHLAERQLIPAFKQGRSWYMRKSTHQAFLAKLEEQAMSNAAGAGR